MCGVLHRLPYDPRQASWSQCDSFDSQESIPENKPFQPAITRGYHQDLSLEQAIPTSYHSRIPSRSITGTSHSNQLSLEDTIKIYHWNKPFQPAITRGYRQDLSMEQAIPTSYQSRIPSRSITGTSHSNQLSLEDTIKIYHWNKPFQPAITRGYRQDLSLPLEGQLCVT